MNESVVAKRLIVAIMVGVAAWGAFQAVGAWRLNHNVWRTVVVAACTVAFLGFWGAMLAVRARRVRGR